MDFFGYYLLAFGAVGTVFVMGWQFGLWLQSMDDRKAMRDLYTDKYENFHDDYYTDAKVKYGASDKYNKPKAKKPRKKKGA